MEPYNVVQGRILPVLIKRSLDLIGPFPSYRAPLALHALAALREVPRSSADAKLARREKCETCRSVVWYIYSRCSLFLIGSGAGEGIRGFYQTCRKSRDLHSRAS